MAIATCGNCGATFEEALGVKVEERQPCPVCGSTTRRIFADVTMPVETLASVSASVISGSVQAITAISDLVLKSVIVAGNKVNEGRLVQAVTLPWFDIIELLAKDPTAAFEIPPHMWEEIIAGAYSKSGFDEVILTPRSGDAGRDVIATIRGVGSVRVIDQVKAYKPPHLVTADDARALYGVLMLDGAAKAFPTTTSDFAPRLTSDPLLGPVIPSRLELINGKMLLARLEELARRRKG
jgi:restriction system protein